jgi:hypothetical protein
MKLRSLSMMCLIFCKDTFFPLTGARAAQAVVFHGMLGNLMNGVAIVRSKKPAGSAALS